MIEVKPLYRYTGVKLVDHKNITEVQQNLNENRMFAYELIARDFLVEKRQNKLFIKKHISTIELEEYEKKLLNEDDSLIRTEDGDKLKEDIGRLNT